jgi:hypothetical protein
MSPSGGGSGDAPPVKQEPTDAKPAQQRRPGRLRGAVEAIETTAAAGGGAEAGELEQRGPPLLYVIHLKVST